MLLMGVVLGGCQPREVVDTTPPPQTPPRAVAALTLSSPAFEAGAAIPLKHTGDGQDASPELRWEGELPEGTQALALIMDDPDAPGGTFCHWLVYDLPPTTTSLAEAVEPNAMLPDNGGKQGTNGFGKIGYGGPAPPPGSVHHYQFTLYALDAPTGLEPGVQRSQLDRAIKDHIIGKGELMGTFSR
jgi:Raf kinase inhibitor-like YbhB/YbcL family protein